jgi:hypothetical protein
MVSSLVAAPVSESSPLPDALKPAIESLPRGLSSLGLGNWSFRRGDDRQFAGTNQTAELGLDELAQSHGATSEHMPLLERLSLGNLPTRTGRELSNPSGSNVRMATEGRGSMAVKRDVMPPDGLQVVLDRVRLFQDSLNEADAGVLGDILPSQETSTRAITFVLRASHSFCRSMRSAPPVPAISPGPDGSVDITWRSPKRVLAANIPEEPDNVVTLYGRDFEGVEPKLSTESDPASDGLWALAWLMR